MPIYLLDAEGAHGRYHVVFRVTTTIPKVDGLTDRNGLCRESLDSSRCLFKAYDSAKLGFFCRWEPALKVIDIW